MKRRLFLLVLAGLLAGCTDTSKPQAKNETPAKDDPAKEKEKEKAKEVPVALTPLKSDEIMQKIEGTKGIVVVDSWASWCIPCKKEFPNLVKIHDKYGKDGVTCMSVTIDEADQHEAALKFLEKMGARFPNYRDTGAFVWLERWKIKGVPFVLVYQDGKLVKQFDNEDPNNQYTYEQVFNLVEELVNKKKAS